ncbi:MAG: trigger factor [Bradymonadia bacterium]
MQVQIQSESAVHRRVEITVPAAVVNKQVQAAYSRLAKRVNIPGFRRGKVPMSVLRKRYQGQVVADVTNQIVDDAWQSAMEQHNITPVARPEWEVGPIKPSEEYSFTVKVEVPPDIELKPFEELAIEMDEYTFEDSHIEHELEHLLEQAVEWQTIEDRDVAETGDRIVFDFNGSIDDVPFEGGTAQGVTLELGSGQFIPGFEEQVVGKKVGEDFTIDVTFPEDYHADQLAGQAAQFACKIHELKGKVTPELDDELAKKFGAEDVEDLRTKVRDGFANRWENVAKRDVFDELRGLVGKQYDFELPPTLFERRIEELKQQQAQAEAQKAAQGESGEEGEASSDEAKSEEQLKADAEIELRCELVLDTIVDQNNIEADEREINAAIEATVQQMPQMAMQLRQYFRRPEQRAGIARSIRHDKALDLVLSKATVTRNPKAVPEHNHDHDHDDHDHDND